MSRLIDADKLIEKLWEMHTDAEVYCYHYTDAEEVKETICGIVAMIDEQPTAYDIEKVIGDYEKQMDEVRHTVYSDNYLQNMSIQTIVNNALFDLSEKIRKGGVE